MYESSETGAYFEWTGEDRLRPFKMPEGQDLQDGDDDDQWLKRIGYESAGSMGSDNGDKLRWFVRGEGTKDGHAFVAVLEEGDAWKAIFLPTYDALLRLRAMVAPIITHSTLEAYIYKIDEIVGKSFRGWHGHDMNHACGLCDPEAMKRLAELRKEAEEMKKTKTP